MISPLAMFYPTCRAGPDAKRFKSAMVSVPARHSLVLSATKTVIFNDRNVMMSSEKTNNSRRDFLVKSMALIPTVVIGGAGAGAIGVATSATAQAAPASEPA
ncbi:gluconate 2-dehydrogenase subunit 3 family protein, partial [Klebsiella pneumoniae]|nr:gluconate 2-dehydrogenase subunit 3 family protein [Klebsiella pneumoniae]